MVTNWCEGSFSCTSRIFYANQLSCQFVFFSLLLYSSNYADASTKTHAMFSLPRKNFSSFNYFRSPFRTFANDYSRNERNRSSFNNFRFPFRTFCGASLLSLLFFFFSCLTRPIRAITVLFLCVSCMGCTRWHEICFSPGTFLVSFLRHFQKVSALVMSAATPEHAFSRNCWRRKWLESGE